MVREQRGAGEQRVLRRDGERVGDIRRNAKRSRRGSRIQRIVWIPLGVKRLRVNTSDLSEQHQGIEKIAILTGVITDRHRATGQQRIAVPQVDAARWLGRQERIELRDTFIDRGDPCVARQRDVDMNSWSDWRR